MSLSRIYQASSFTLGTEVILEQKAAHHLIQVLRHSVGDEVILFNGKGGEYLAEIVSIHKKATTLKLQKYIEKDVESPLKIHLVQGIPRGEKMDFILQKAVELGVHEITPIFTQHCNIKLAADRIEKRILHWQAVIISACEQSGRAYVPQLNAPVTYPQWLANNTPQFGLILHPDATSKLNQLSFPECIVTIVIGPEGGLSEDEVNQAEHKGMLRLNLGPRVLRTETAPLAAITALQCQWGDIAQ